MDSERQVTEVKSLPLLRPELLEGGCRGESWTAGRQNLTIVHQT